MFFPKEGQGLTHFHLLHWITLQVKFTELWANPTPFCFSSIEIDQIFILKLSPGPGPNLGDESHLEGEHKELQKWLLCEEPRDWDPLGPGRPSMPQFHSAKLQIFDLDLCAIFGALAYQCVPWSYTVDMSSGVEYIWHLGAGPALILWVPTRAPAGEPPAGAAAYAAGQAAGDFVLAELWRYGKKGSKWMTLAGERECIGIRNFPL